MKEIFYTHFRCEVKSGVSYAHGAQGSDKLMWLVVPTWSLTNADLVLL